MNVKIYEPSGYCQGVYRAINIAKKAKIDNPDKKIIVLGMLVHNNDALKEIEDLSITTLYSKEKKLIDLIDMIEDDAIVILTAHGHSKDIEDKLTKRHLKYIDATCPFVKKAMNDMNKYINEGYSIIYIGKENHPESDAALSLSKHVHLLTLDGKINDSIKKEKKTIVVSQSTFSSLDVDNLLEKIKHEVKNVNFYPSICNSSLLRQKALLNIDKNTDLILVVGGKKSNNTLTLYSLAKKHFVDTKVIMLENKDELKKDELTSFKEIAIISGASTPKKVIEDIKTFVEQSNN